jgi:hypothetical protein
VQFDRPPVGFDTLMPWRSVVGLTDDDFKRFEERRRLVRIVCQPQFQGRVRESWAALLMPAMEESLS